MASYGHDNSMGARSLWVVDILSLVRPILTFGLVLLVAVLYFYADAGGKASIEASVIFLCASAVTWWFGDRTLRKK
jgi:hypothetical protein